MGKIFAIGDIHGCLSKIKNLMGLINIDSEQDRVVFLGDYIDRGPDVREVVQFVLDFMEQNRNVICLMGNHEEIFLDYLKNGSNETLFFMNGGLSTLKSYNFPKSLAAIPAKHRQFFSQLASYYDAEEYIFVHAGLRPGIPWDKQKRDDMLWIRDEFINSSYNFGKKVVFGHTHFLKPLIDNNKIGIDTGAVYGGKLSCLELPLNKLYQS